MLQRKFFIWSIILFSSAMTNYLFNKIGTGFEDHFDNSGALFLNGTSQPIQNTCFVPQQNFSEANDSRSIFEFLTLFQEIIFDSSPKLTSHLENNDNADNLSSAVAVCDIFRQSPLHTEKGFFIAGMLSDLIFLSFAATAHTVVSFIIDWKKLNRFPEKSMFYVNLCWSIALFLWNLLFIIQSYKEKSDYMDDTVQLLQPRSGLSLCSITFVLIYFFTLAATVWFVILIYTLYFDFSDSSNQNSYIPKKKLFFHMCAWCIPLLLTMARKTTEVDGNSMSDISFVEFATTVMIVAFVIALIFVVFAFVSLGVYFLALYICNIEVMSNREKVTIKSSRKKFPHIRHNRGSIALCLALFYIIYFCHSYDVINCNEWNENYEVYINCPTMNSNQSSSRGGPSECVVKSKPNVYFLYIYLLCLFIIGIMISFLIPPKSPQEIWKSFRRNLWRSSKASL